MKTCDTLPIDKTERGFPDEAELAALRSWYAGLDARAAVARYLATEEQPERPRAACSAGFVGGSSRSRRRAIAEIWQASSSIAQRKHRRIG